VPLWFQTRFNLNEHGANVQGYKKFMKPLTPEEAAKRKEEERTPTPTRGSSDGEG